MAKIIIDGDQELDRKGIIQIIQDVGLKIVDTTSTRESLISSVRIQMPELIIIGNLALGEVAHFSKLDRILTKKIVYTYNHNFEKYECALS